MSANYQRIGVTSPKDLEKLRPLIHAYVAQPSQALSVTEIALNPSEVSRPTFSLPGLDSSAVETTDAADDDAADHALEVYVRSLQLDEEFTESMLSSLKPSAFWGTMREQRTASHSFACTAAIILLSLCKNITTIYAGSSLFGSMGTPRGRGNVIRSLLQRYLLKSNYGFLAQPVLQKLERVEIILSEGLHDDERMYINIEILDVFQFFHRLPAIRSVVMEGVQDYQSDQRLFVPRTGNMRKLHIGPVDAPSFMLATVIFIPKELEDLKVVIGGLWSTDGGQPRIVMKTIRNAILQHKRTLRVLDIDMELTMHDDEPPDDSEDEKEAYSDDLWATDDGQSKRYGEEHLRIDRADSILSTPQTGHEDESTAGFFSDFKSLTHLSIGVQMLLQLVGINTPANPSLIDALPPSLESLCIYGYKKGDSSSIDSQFGEFMSSKSEKLPNLKEIHGVQEVLPDVIMKHGYNPGEDDLWQRPEKDVRWKEA